MQKTIPQEIVPARVEATHYDMTFLKQEKIRADQALINAQAAVVAIDKLLAEADKLSIVEEVVISAIPLI